MLFMCNLTFSGNDLETAINVNSFLNNNNITLLKASATDIDIDVTNVLFVDNIYVCSCYATITNRETGYTETISMIGFGLTASDACGNCMTSASFAARVRIQDLQDQG